MKRSAHVSSTDYGPARGHDGRADVPDAKRLLGAYYSPEPYARALVRWSLGGKVGTVLDPSYGGCAMLRVAVEEVDALGAERPTDLVFGSDIDTRTARWAAHLVSLGVPPEHLREADFLALTPGDELPLVSAVCGNPPYVRHHWLKGAARTKAAAAAAAAGVQLSGRASLWAYFAVHAARFVLPGGRMALLLPGAVTQVDYAQAVLSYLEERFDDVLVVRIRERLFEDAQEETVALLASGARVTGRRTLSRHEDVDDLSGLERLLAEPPPLAAPSMEPVEGIADWKLRAVPAECLTVLSRVLADDVVHPLRKVARLALGTVTGANKVFVLTEKETSEFDVRAHTVPVVARSAWLDGPVLTSSGLAKASAGARSRLLTLPSTFRLDRRTRLGRHLAAAEVDEVHTRHHCQREPWWALGNVPVPDAFLPYTMAGPRGIALNMAAAASTNTVHQVWWRGTPTLEVQRARVLTTWSTLGRACAELYGRHYGGGVLKLELGSAGRLPVVETLVVADAEWAECQHDPTQARAIADAALLRAGIGLTERHLRVMNDAAEALAAARAGRPRNAPQVKQGHAHVEG